MKLNNNNVNNNNCSINETVLINESGAYLFFALRFFFFSGFFDEYKVQNVLNLIFIN